MGKLFNILSIDGGGIRGVYPAYILKCIEERLNIKLNNAFDMITGTSTGAILAGGVAIGIPANHLLKMYSKHGASIFKRKPYWGIKKELTQPMFQSIYDNKYLYNVLGEQFGDICLWQISKPLILPATDIGNGCVHVFKSGYSEDFTRDTDVKLKDAIMASCSAPTYFDPHKLDSYLLADGGLWSNNPSFVAAIDAQKRLGIKKDDIRVFSIGTGHSKTMYGTNPQRKWGLLNGWRNKEFINFILALQSQSAVNYLKLHLQPEQILRINFETDNALSLDDVGIIDDLITKADHDFTHNSSSIDQFLNSDKEVIIND